MRYAYLETSGLDALVKSGRKVRAIRDWCDSRGTLPCLGLLTVNECAQAILSGHVERARSTFQLIRDLQPRFLADPRTLYDAELRLLRSSVPVDALISTQEQEFISGEITALAAGRISAAFLEVIRPRLRKKFEAWPRTMQSYLEEVKKLRRASQSHAPRFAVFEELEEFFRPDLARFVGAIRELHLVPGEAETIAEAIDRFPAIRGTVYFWWNAFFICLAHGRTPATDKVDDWRHVVEASYCIDFMTNDRQLYRSLARLNKALNPVLVETWLQSAV